MAYAKSVEFTLAAFGKARQATGVAHTVHLPHSASQYLVWVRLVTHVPHYPVLGCVVDVVQGHCKFDHSQACPEVAAGLPYAIE